MGWESTCYQKTEAPKGSRLAKCGSVRSFGSKTAALNQTELHEVCGQGRENSKRKESASVKKTEGAELGGISRSTKRLRNWVMDVGGKKKSRAGGT